MSMSLNVNKRKILIDYLIFDESQQGRYDDCDLGSSHDTRELEYQRFATTRWHRNVDWKVAQNGSMASTLSL